MSWTGSIPEKIKKMAEVVLAVIIVLAARDLLEVNIHE